MENNDALLLFQIGPVQSFIAQAETVTDLAVGSHILSQLTAAALKTIPDYAKQTVFPATEGNNSLEGIPNRFLVFVPREEAKTLAKQAEKATRAELTKLAATAREFAVDKEAFDKQIEAFLQITWVILENPTGDMGKDYCAIGKLMALRRNTREFNQWEEVGGTQKDFLTGKENALDKKRELGAMNLLKRYYNIQNINLPDLPQYFAVIAMDGDKMGETLSGFKSREEHLQFSRSLVAFANDVKGIAKTHSATLIYAGGDDVLAVIDAKQALKFARELSDRFKTCVNKTASAGIAVAHRKTPLQDVVHAAHAAESRAKQVYNRDALAVSIYKRSGEILEWGCKWNSAAFTIYNALTNASDTLAGFSHKLARFLEPYNLKGSVPAGMSEVIAKDTIHALTQTEKANAALNEADLLSYLAEPMTQSHVEDFLNLFLCETFINRPRGEED